MHLEEQPAALQVDPALARFAPLVDIAVCPISKAPLRLVGAVELKDRVTVADQSKIDSGLVGAFVSEEANRAYSIRGPIVNFLESESLRIDRGASLSVNAVFEEPDQEAKSSVRRWYDEFGWQKNERGDYYDS